MPERGLERLRLGCQVHCEACHDSEHYSTILFGTHARAVIAAHPAESPLFLYLPHQAVHVGNAAEDSHPSYALDQAPIEYIERYAWVEDVERRNLSAMVSSPGFSAAAAAPG